MIKRLIIRNSIQFTLPILLISSAIAADDSWVLKSKDFSLGLDVFNQTLAARNISSDELNAKHKQALLQELFIRENLLLQQDSIPSASKVAFDKRLQDYRSTQLAKLALDALSEEGMPDFSERAMEIYQANRAEYQMPLRLRVRILVKNLPAAGQEPVLQKLEETRQQILDNTLDFKQAVLKHSDETKKKLTEGDSFWFSRTQKPQAFFQAASELNTDNVLSEIFTIDHKAYLLQFLGRQEAVEQSFAEVGGQIINTLQDEYRSQRRKELLSELRDRFKHEVEIHPDWAVGDQPQ